MKRSNLTTLLGAAAANGTLIGIAVSDKPDAPLFARDEMPRVSDYACEARGMVPHAVGSMAVCRFCAAARIAARA